MMSNMSYCRFENTARDLQDCRDALDAGARPDNVSADEAKAMEHLILLCRDIADNFRDVVED